MKRIERRTGGRAFAACALTLIGLLTACDSPTAVRDVTFAPELGVDLDAMVETESGLFYEDLEPGSGDPAQRGQTAFVYYQGWLPDGTLFDARQPPADPFSFTLGGGRVIAGWDEGVEGMRPDGVRLLVIPPSLGYGDRPVGPIPAGSVLVFEIRLVSAQ